MKVLYQFIFDLHSASFFITHHCQYVSRHASERTMMVLYQLMLAPAVCIDSIEAGLSQAHLLSRTLASFLPSHSSILSDPHCIIHITVFTHSQHLLNYIHKHFHLQRDLPGATRFQVGASALKHICTIVFHHHFLFELPIPMLDILFTIIHQYRI